MLDLPTDRAGWQPRLSGESPREEATRVALEGYTRRFCISTTLWQRVAECLSHPVPSSERLGWKFPSNPPILPIGAKETRRPRGLARRSGCGAERKPEAPSRIGEEAHMTRQEMLLTVLSLADGKPFTPVQIQKSLFLADDKIRDAFESRYDFQPYDYGPFDRQVYVDAETLSQRGLVEIGIDERGGWQTYAATKEGIHQGSELRKQLNERQHHMLSRIVKVVRSLSFTELVSAIYRSYPPMRERSVFRD
jgi:uncharacterized protein